MPERLTAFLSAQGDYLVFAGVVLFFTMLAALVLRRIRPDARLAWSVWLASAVVLLLGWQQAERHGNHARKESAALISAMATTYAKEMEIGGHSTINEQTLPDDPVYLKLIAAQIRWEKLNLFALDIYTFRKRADGTNILVVDSETDYNKDGVFSGENESRTPIGKEYHESVEGLEKAFAGEANFDDEVTADEWGSTVSMFVPMHDVAGRMEAVLGVDFDATAWLAAIAKARHEVMAVVSVLLVFIVGGGLGIVLLRADIQRRAESERLLRASEERLLLTIRQMPLGFIEWDIEARAQMWNPAAERIFGFQSAEVKGKKMFPLIVAPSAAGHVDEIWASLLRNTGGVHSLNENVTQDGRTIVCEWFNTPLIGPDNRVVAVFSVIQDITERVNLDKQLQRSERLSSIGQLSAGMAHDFNNILTIITCHAGLSQTRANIPAEVKNDLCQIEAAALRAAGLTRQLLAFSRQQAMFPLTLSLGKLVQDLGKMLARLIGEDIHFKVSAAEALPPIEADPAMIEQVVTNLVLNARDALSRGGNLTVDVDFATVAALAVPAVPGARAGDFVRLTVRDTGTGISPENLARIFEPFFTTKPTGKGTGLGLSVVHGIVQQHGGWLTVASAVGKGTVFEIYFPPSNKSAASSDTAQVQRSQPPPPHKSAGTLLLVEDEELVRELACDILRGAGYQVFAAADGPQALEVWRQQGRQIDLLLTDMVMPNGMTGRELAERILAERPSLPVIFASGYSIDLADPSFCESERMRFLPKPYQTQQLIAIVQKCFHQGGAAD
jgi:PAS domain S-box-containing protein